MKKFKQGGIVSGFSSGQTLVGCPNNEEFFILHSQIKRVQQMCKNNRPTITLSKLTIEEWSERNTRLHILKQRKYKLKKIRKKIFWNKFGIFGRFIYLCTTKRR